MRSALVLAAVLALAGCTADAPPPSAGATPADPCAATRDQPPEGSQEQRLQGDLDADGRTDEVVSWLRDGERVVQAWLATGKNAEPQPLFRGDLLQARDLDGDGAAEVLVARVRGVPQVVLGLEGCRLTVRPAASPTG